MTINKLAAALLTTALVGGAAYAQTAPAPAQKADTTTAAPAAQRMDLKGKWRVSKLMGLDVYNDANEKLGDINEIILDNTGKVAAVVIGVGGFLGMGEHDVAVTVDKLKFVEDAVRTSTTSTDRPAATANAPATTTANTTGAATTATTTRNASTNDWSPDHAVMSATKDQLKAMSEFKYSDYN